MQFFFAPYRLDTDNHDLFRNEQPIGLRPKTYAVLLYMVERAGRLALKSDILSTVWPDSETIDSSLKGCIHELRTIFGDHKDHPEWIETKTGVGYRFLRTVTTGENVTFEIKNLHELPWTVEESVRKNIVLSRSNVAGLTDASTGSVDQWVALAMNNPEGRCYLLANGIQAGFWHFEFVGPELYEEIRAGKLDDGDLTVDRVRQVIEPGPYDIYALSFLIDHRYRGISALRAMYETLINRVIELRHKGIEIDRIITNAWTAEGAGLCRTLKLREVGPHQECGTIYEGRLGEHPRFV